MFKKKKVVRKVNMEEEEPEVIEEESELPTYEDEPVEEPVKSKAVSKPNVVQVPVFLTQADLNKMTYDNHLMLMEILKLAKEE